MNDASVAIGGRDGNFKVKMMKELMKQLFDLDFGHCRIPIRPLDQRTINKITKDLQKYKAFINFE